MKRRNWILLAVLVLAMLLLSACGVPMEGVDVTKVQPDGPWQTFVVWPLANILIWLAELLKEWGIPYYWGFAIIVFTFIIKLVTFPLTLSQVRGMQAQKNLQPKIAELQKKYGKDRERLAQEQMRLYKEAGVNPLSGCLPLVIQMPILFGLYAALVAVSPFLLNASFFWIPNLTFPSYTAGMGWIMSAWQAGANPMLPEFPGYSGYYILVAYLILPILLIVTQFVMQKWMTPTPMGDGDQAGMSQNMSLIMTLFFGYFTLQVPAGLTLYWVTSNLLQMLQQWMTTRYFMKRSPAPALAVAAAAGAAARYGGQPGHACRREQQGRGHRSYRPVRAPPRGRRARAPAHCQEHGRQGPATAVHGACRQLVRRQERQTAAPRQPRRAGQDEREIAHGRRKCVHREDGRRGGRRRAAEAGPLLRPGGGRGAEQGQPRAVRAGRRAGAGPAEGAPCRPGPPARRRRLRQSRPSPPPRSSCRPSPAGTTAGAGRSAPRSLWK